MFRRNFFGGEPWGGARPTARLASPRLGAAGGNGCKVPGTELRPVFQLNPTTKVCGVFWMDPATTQYPDCVQAPPDYLGGGYEGWIPPGCAPAPAPAPVPEPVPPAAQPPGPVPEPPNYYPVSGQCPAGQVWNGSICEADPAPVTRVSPGASVPIMPRPFPSVPLQAPVRISPQAGPTIAPPEVPQKQFAPSQRPSCALTPYKQHMFPGKTIPTRPDAFGNPQQWTS